MKSIIIFFSRAGSNWVNDKVADLKIGNCELIANYVKKKIKADLFKINTKHKYTNEYYTATKEAKEELLNNKYPELVEYPNNLDEYDKIYLIYPIWWDTCPMAVFSLLKKYDFKKKIIIPICSHEGSGIANSVKDIKKYTNAIVKDAFETRGYKCQDIDNDKELQSEIDNFLTKNEL